MSYHETYDFFAIDRALTRAEMRALRAISSRATITPARFHNSYDWGGLKGDPRDMLRRYFDLFVHTGNGIPDLGMLRFPADRIEVGHWRPYLAEQRGASTSQRAASIATGAATRSDVAILTMMPAEDTTLRWATRSTFDSSDDDESGERGESGARWDAEDAEDDEDAPEQNFESEASWLVPLALVRADLLAGDQRPLYLLWLLSVQCGERRATSASVPVPPNLAPLSGTLSAFAEFLRLNADLLTVALAESRGEHTTVGELLVAARDCAAGRRRRKAERTATARARRLAALEKRQEAEWREIGRLLDAERGRPSIYDDVIRRLAALRELAVDRRRPAGFRDRVRALLEEHGHKAAFRRRVREAELDVRDETEAQAKRSTAPAAGASAVTRRGR